MIIIGLILLVIGIFTWLLMYVPTVGFLLMIGMLFFGQATVLIDDYFGIEKPREIYFTLAEYITYEKYYRTLECEPWEEPGWEICHYKNNSWMEKFDEQYQ